MRLHPLFSVRSMVAVMLFAVSWAPGSAAETPRAEPRLAIELSRESFRLYTQRRFAEAEVAAKRSLELSEAALPPDDIHIAVGRENLATIYLAEQRKLDAARLFEQALPVWEKVLGPKSKGFAERLSMTGMMYQNLGLLDQAEPLLHRSLDISEATLPADSPEVGTSLANLAMVYLFQSDWEKTESTLKRAIPILEKTPGAKQLPIGFLLRGLAVAQKGQAHYADAEDSFRRTITVIETAGGPYGQFLPKALDDLSSLYQEEGRYIDAEPLERRALDIDIHNGVKPDDPHLAPTLNNLASLYWKEGRTGEAKQFFQRSMDILNKANAGDTPNFALLIGNFAVLLSSEGDTAKAETLLKRARSIFEQRYASPPPAYAVTLQSLGTLYFEAGRYTEAEPVMLRAVEENERLGEQSDLSATLNNLGNMYLLQNRYAEAERELTKSLKIDEQIFGKDYRESLTTLTNLAGVYRSTGRPQLAYEQMKRAVGIIRSQIEIESASEYSREKAIAGVDRQVVLQFISDAATLPGTQAERRDAVDASLEAVQILEVAEAAHAVAQMSARLAAGADALANDIRQRETDFGKWRELEKRLVESLGHPIGPNAASVTAVLQQQTADARTHLERLDAQIAQHDPRYAQLSSLIPVPIAETRALLAPDEAMLVYVVDRDGVWLWTVMRDDTRLFHLDIDLARLERDVRTLHDELNPAAGAARQSFDVALAHTLYQAIVAPAAAALTGVRHLIVVPDGVLRDLPLGVLITEPPPPIAEAADYRHVAWFARAHPISMLPAVSSLRALRQIAGQSVGAKPFLGIGDPTLNDSPGCNQGITTAALLRGGAINVEAVRQLCALHETAEELHALARSQGASPETDVYIGARATLPQVEALPLASYRVIAFATHGLTAGDMKNLAEPALVLTPPTQPSAHDVGLLTASEVARLKLDADWVILSACNTAAGEAPGGEGLSGLARAFFYAGARALLVSHWPVDSAAAVELTTNTLKELHDDPGIGRAEALQRAELKLLDSSNPSMANPAFWAPFTLLGIGSV